MTNQEPRPAPTDTDWIVMETVRDPIGTGAIYGVAVLCWIALVVLSLLVP